MSELNARPFLKWAGGKSQLLEQFTKYYPKNLFGGKIKKYIEPFLGGGAVFFYLQSQYNFEEIILNDINEELVLTYYVVQNNVKELIEQLEILENKYLEGDMVKKEEIFYEQRELFNIEKKILNYNLFSSEWIGHAARMIFLNKTCFNGLYRQNKKGEFNVPFGKRKKVTVCDKDNLIAANSALKKVKLLIGDFENVSEYIDENSFLYIDPPYRPLTQTSSFTDYSKIPFDDESQKRLAKWTRNVIDEKGAYFMLSNSDPKNVDEFDNFFEELYKGFNITRVKATRSINSKGTGRGEINELLIYNYDILNL
ncbi:DNA adenine methylase [Caloramator proteoclasticus]|uniref:Site-specific DNA-methyltransferase (adenine-specific) n=1 Tax=Caloramator proteoclasticus DSM 10124 TaxID=1121262 RepID=A0A1M5BSD9_9CLOT|nr:DNA adenine methylase [Caloramator proteoclasticus]SHF45449.1 DNA adenine methylase [Caloramator proteoclasticus DSM 10124]